MLEAILDSLSTIIIRYEDKKSEKRNSYSAY